MTEWHWLPNIQTSWPKALQLMSCMLSRSDDIENTLITYLYLTPALM